MQHGAGENQRRVSGGPAVHGTDAGGKSAAGQPGAFPAGG